MTDIDLRRRHVIAEWIRMGRAEKNWTIGQLAQEAEMSRPGLSDIANKNTDAKADSLKKLSDALGKPIPMTGAGEDRIDPVRTVQVRMAADLLEAAAKGIKDLLQAGNLDEAQQILRWVIDEAEKQLLDDDVENLAPGAAEAVLGGEGEPGAANGPTAAAGPEDDDREIHDAGDDGLKKSG